MSGIVPAILGSCMAARVTATPDGKMRTPSVAQTAKYATAAIAVRPPACDGLMREPNDAWKQSNAGMSDGSIIATIITTHMLTNDVIPPNHDWSGITIHMCDIVQPPGIHIEPIVDIDADVAIVIAALATKTIAETPSST
jgi:hypothetical protein